MNNYFKEDQKMIIEELTSEKSISGTITLTFKFEEGFNLEYDQSLCSVQSHYNEEKIPVIPIDLNIEYSFSIEKQEEIMLDAGDYYLDDISDFNDYKSQDFESSSFFVEFSTVSPNNQFLIICVSVSIQKRQDSFRLMIIDMKNHQIKKVFFRNCFMGQPKPQFFKEGNFSIINITKDYYEESRFLFLNLQNGIQNELIVKFQQQIRKIDYDESSGCIFYITVNLEIYQIPFYLEDFTIDKSKQKIYQINSMQSLYIDNRISLSLLYDYIAVITHELGLFSVVKIGSNCKSLKNYSYFQYLVPQYIFSKAFVVMSDSRLENLMLIDISRGKIIRQKVSGFFEKYSKPNYAYSQNQSYYLSIVQYPNTNEYDDDKQYEKKIQWKIFDFIRGTEVELQQRQLTDQQIRSSTFTRNILIQSYQNKLSYELKL